VRHAETIVVQMIVLKRKKQEEHNFPAVMIKCVLHIYIRAHIESQLLKPVLRVDR
jgi:hypothetical protein